VGVIGWTARIVALRPAYDRASSRIAARASSLKGLYALKRPAEPAARAACPVRCRNRRRLNASSRMDICISYLGETYQKPERYRCCLLCVGLLLPNPLSAINGCF